ncbi:MAG TPA: DNA helicase, partial [Armatimonadota bacterium]|nr:DNA helicase [Armatimonadota bacterium]
ILYPAPAPEGQDLGDEERALREREGEAARRLFGLGDELLELVEDPEAYLESVCDLVTGPESLTRRVGAQPFEAVPFHLTYRCDGCLYNEFCMKWAAEADDLSLIPHLTAADKAALKRAGVGTTRELAGLKDLVQPVGGAGKATELVPAPGREALCRQVATTWPVGHRADELIHRARRYRKWKKDPIEALSYIPSKGYGSLPYCDERQNPNLVRVYLDAQHDYLHDRIYMLGALVVGCDGGKPARRESIVHLAEGPPDNAEKERRLFVRWIHDLLRAVARCAAPDAEGRARAPVHLVFFNSFDQQLMLEGLSRHLNSILGAAPALYDFMTQLAAFDSPIATFLDEEIRELKNYPMVCQSLQSVAASLKFKWDAVEPFTRLFQARMFDQWRKIEGEGAEPQWYTGRARFNSQIPLEYAYAAWDELERPRPGAKDDYAGYRETTLPLLRRFQARRMEALEHITADFRGNHLTEKRPFDLPDLAGFSDTARSLGQALDEFVTIERHVELHDWKRIRHTPPERRVLMGETLLARYLEDDQEPGVAQMNRDNERRRLLREQYDEQYRAENPDAARVRLSKEQIAEAKWEVEGLRVRLRLETDTLECSLDEALGLITLQPGDRFVLNARWTEDGRLPPEERTAFMPTPKQMLYGLRADFKRLVVERDDEGKAVRGWVEVELAEARGGDWSRGFVFSTFPRRTLEAGALYTLDPCPNNWYGYY